MSQGQTEQTEQRLSLFQDLLLLAVAHFAQKYGEVAAGSHKLSISMKEVEAACAKLVDIDYIPAEGVHIEVKEPPLNPS